jgi:hypothetical protein
MKYFLSVLLITFVFMTCEAKYKYNFNSQHDLEESWGFKGANFLIPKTKFYIDNSSSAEDGKVIKLDSRRSTGVFATVLPIDVKKFPILRWRWRILATISLAPNAKEPDDQAGVVYIGDGSLLKQFSLAYRWEYNTKVNSKQLIKYTSGRSEVFAICVRNKETKVGEWVIEEKNILDDYKLAFSRHPKGKVILCLGANSQYTKSNTIVEIDYIEFLPLSKSNNKNKK